MNFEQATQLKERIEREAPNHAAKVLRRPGSEICTVSVLMNWTPQAELVLVSEHAWEMQKYLLVGGTAPIPFIGLTLEEAQTLADRIESEGKKYGLKAHVETQDYGSHKKAWVVVE